MANGSRRLFSSVEERGYGIVIMVRVVEGMRAKYGEAMEA